MPFLVERILRPAPVLRQFVKDSIDGAIADPIDGAIANPFDYRDVIRVRNLAEWLSAKDARGDSVSTWTRAIRRWVSEEAAPEPDYIRRTLSTLGFDWLTGLGRSGYGQHALVLLHALWKQGSRSRVAMQASAAFPGSAYRPDSDRALWTVIRAGSNDLARLDNAARASRWEDALGEVRLPVRCAHPPDFPASRNLYTAWMLLESALLNKHGSIQQRLLAVDESVAREVHAWVEDILRNNRPVRKTRISHRRKT